MGPIFTVSALVIQVIEKLGQDPYVAYKLDSLMTQQNIKVCHFDNIDIHLGTCVRNKCI